ncbi:MAG: hypothetical protein JKY52_19780 [Flavobacteriales bacterium]|nr:hypothetical protein [Flavobacteriales bacterium]
MTKLLCVFVFFILAHSAAWAQKNPWFPVKKGKVYFFEVHDKDGAHTVQYECLGKSKGKISEVLFRQIKVGDNHTLADTMTFTVLKEEVLSSGSNRLDGTVNRPLLKYTSKDTLFVSGILLHEQRRHRLLYTFYSKPYMMIDSNRFNDILITKIELFLIGEGVTNEDNGEPIISMEHYFASGIGLLAHVSSDVTGRITYSKVLKYPYKGKWIEHHENGTVSHKMKYKKGERHGKYVSWNAKGQKMELLEYADGNLDGVQHYFFNTGEIHALKTYSKGVLKSVILKYRNQQVAEMGSYKDEKRHGIWRQWDESGKLVAEAEYDLGMVVTGFWPFN